MPATVYLKKGDLLPVVDAYLRDETGALAATNFHTVTFIMKNATTGVVKVNASASTGHGLEDGHVQYRWAGSDTDTAGTYTGEFVIQTNVGILTYYQTFPNDGYITIIITERLA